MPKSTVGFVSPLSGSPPMVSVTGVLTITVPVRVPLSSLSMSLFGPGATSYGPLPFVPPVLLM